MVDAIPRESVHLLLPAGPGSRPVRWMVYHYGFACAAPRSFSSHLEQVSLFFYRPPTATLPRHFLRERVRARTRTRPDESLLFFSPLRGELT